MQELLDSEFLRVPNIILQMQRVLGNASAYACLQFIWAKTGGWQNLSDTISYSQFRDDKRYGTGLSTKTVQRSVEKLADLGVISVTPSFNNMHEFTLNIAKIKELVESQAKTKCPSLDKPSQVNLSTSQDNLSASQDNLSAKHGQNDLHTRTITQEPLHKNSTQEGGEQKKPSKGDLLANELFDTWLSLSGQKIKKTDKRMSHIKARLKDGFSADDITEAMKFVATDAWHVQNGHNTIELVIRSTDQLEKKLLKAQAEKNKPAANRANDKLAVNSNWENATQPDIKPNMTYEELMESMQ